MILFFFFQAEDGIRDSSVTGVQTCALPICSQSASAEVRRSPSKSRKARAISRNQLNCTVLSKRSMWARMARTRSRDRKSVVEGKRVDLGGRRIIKKKKIIDKGGT